MSLLIVHTLKAFSKVPQYLPASAPASYALATTDDSPCRHPLARASTLQTLAESLGLVPGTQITELRVQGRKERDTRGRCLAQGPGPAGRWGPCSRVDTHPADTLTLLPASPASPPQTNTGLGLAAGTSCRLPTSTPSLEVATSAFTRGGDSPPPPNPRPCPHPRITQPLCPLQSTLPVVTLGPALRG